MNHRKINKSLYRIIQYQNITFIKLKLFLIKKKIGLLLNAEKKGTF